MPHNTEDTQDINHMDTHKPVMLVMLHKSVTFLPHKLAMFNHHTDITHLTIAHLQLHTHMLQPTDLTGEDLLGEPTKELGEPTKDYKDPDYGIDLTFE